MQYRDAERVAELHRAAMGNSVWAQLGLGYLAALYRALVDCPYFVGFVYTEDTVVVGFIAGSLDTAAMMADLRRRRWQFLVPHVAVGVLRRPALIPKLLRTGAYTKASGAGDVPGESLFCSFVPNLRGKRVSGHINKVLFDEFLARGHRAVKITTEVDNEGANRQLLSWGFEVRQEFSFYGKRMVTYVLDLRDHPRIEPVSRHPVI